MAMYPNTEQNPHPLCPTCQTNEEVCRKTRIETEELQWLDADGHVISAADGDERYETGTAWYCSGCGNEWGHEGSLKSAAPRPSYVGHAVYAAELRAAEAFCLELRKFQPLWVDSARRFLQDGSDVQPPWTAIELAALLRRGLTQLPERLEQDAHADSWESTRRLAWPIPDWSTP